MPKNLNTYNIMKKFLLSLLATVALVSCGDKNDDAPAYSAEEAKAAVTATMNSFYDCLKKANDGGFADFFYNTVFKEAGRDQYGQKETWFDQLGDQFDRQFDLNKDNGFNYQELKGTYTWNSTTKQWDKTANTTNNIVWLFPATASSTTNNARGVVENYEDFKATFEGGDVSKLPIKGHAVVTVDNVKMLEVIIGNVRYEQNANFAVPTSADITIFTNPFTTTIRLTKQTAENFIFDFAFSSPQGCTTGLKANVKLTSGNYDSFATFEEAVDNIHVLAIQNDFQIIAQADVKSVHKSGKKIGDLTVEEANTYVKAELYKNGRKVADVKIDKENDEEVVYFIFSDGSKEKAEKYVSDFEDRVTEIFKRFTKTK